MTFSPTVYLQNKLFKYSNYQIIDGYFKGIKYGTREGLSFAIIAGTYEKELFPILDDLKNFNNLIVIGAGDGYYAAGLLKKFSNLSLFAFEILSDRKVNLVNNLSRNNIDEKNYTLYDDASIDNLQSLLQKFPTKDKNFIIIDVEGFEEVLLNPLLIPELNNCTILVEIHDHLVPKVGALIKTRFKSHINQTFKTTERTVSDIKRPFNFFEKLFLKKQLTRLLGEGRSVDMEWFYLKPPIL